MASRDARLEGFAAECAAAGDGPVDSAYAGGADIVTGAYSVSPARAVIRVLTLSCRRRRLTVSGSLLSSETTGRWFWETC